MGGLAEEQVRLGGPGRSSSATATLIERVLAGDEPINDLHIEIDNRCFTAARAATSRWPPTCARSSPR